MSSLNRGKTKYLHFVLICLKMDDTVIPEAKTDTKYDQLWLNTSLTVIIVMWEKQQPRGDHIHINIVNAFYT